MEEAGLSVSRHALSEHHEIEELMEELTTNDPTVQGWLIRAKVLCEKVHHHLEEEEKVFFQLSGKILSESQKTTLAKAYATDYERLKLKYSSLPNIAWSENLQDKKLGCSRRRGWTLGIRNTINLNQA